MNFAEHKKNKLKLYCVALSFAFFIVGILYNFFINDSGKIYYTNYMISSIMLFYLYLVIIRQIDFFKIITVFIIFMGCYYILFIPLFSPIDEGAHFDYILHIIQQHKLPLLSDVMNSKELYEVTGNLVPVNTQYEAVHPPLYYLVASIIIFISQKKLLLSVIILRFFGVFLLIVIFYFSNKTYESLVQKKIIKKNDLLYHSIMLAFFLNPGFVTRMISISNEQLIVCLMTILIYYIVKIVGVPPSFRQILVLSLLSGAMILTKFTSIYIVGVIVLLCLVYKQLYKAFVYLSVTLFITLPWFIFNYYHYEKLTATSLHVKFVKGIVNPENIQLTPYYILQKISFFLGTFWNPQESGFPNIREPFYTITSIMNGIIIGVILIMIVYSLKNIKKIKNVQTQLITLILIGILLNILVLCYGTITEDVDIIIGRYIYMNMLSMTILTVIFVQKVITHKHQRSVGYVIMMMTCFLTANFMLDTAQSDQNLASKIKKDIIYENLSLDNYSNERYNSVLDVKELKSIPLKLGESSNKNVVNQSLIKENSITMNNIKSVSENDFQIIGSDPFIVIDNNHQVKPTDLIKLVIENNQNAGIGQLFWNNGKGFSEEDSVTFKITEGKNAYVIPVGRNAKWIKNEEIVGLRLDFDSFKEYEKLIISDFDFMNN